MLMTVTPATLALCMIQAALNMTELIAGNGRLFVSDHLRS